MTPRRPVPPFRPKPKEADLRQVWNRKMGTKAPKEEDVKSATVEALDHAIAEEYKNR